MLFTTNHILRNQNLHNNLLLIYAKQFTHTNDNLNNQNRNGIMANHSKRMNVHGVDMNTVLRCAQLKETDAISVVNLITLQEYVVPKLNV